MVKLSINDERVFGDLRRRLTDLHGHLTPATERFAPIDVHVRGLMDRLSHYDPTVVVAVVGHPKSGKSSLINAMLGVPILPDNTARDLLIVPFSGDQPMIRRAAGKAIASGVESCREHLISEADNWVDEFADRRLHARLPLISGDHCYASNWAIKDTACGTAAITPTLSSVASRIHSPNVFVGDKIIYCVNAILLGTDHEWSTLDYVVGDIDAPLETRKRLVDRTLFVLTNADMISDVENHIENVHKKERPAITSIAELKEHFKELASRRLGVPVSDDQILPFSGRNALMAKRMVTIDRPDMNEVYDYCELLFGSQYMQRIDSIEEEELLRRVKNHALEEGMVISGGNALIEQLKLVDFHAVRHLMASICATGTECNMQLITALDQATPQIQEQVEENQDLLEVLLQELEWTVETSESIEKYAVEMHDHLAKLVEDGFEEFFADRLRELRFVLEHRELAWFRERQHCTVVEMNASLKQLEAFTERYIKHRAFLEAKLVAQQQQSVDGSTEGSSAWEFIDNNISGLLCAMEKEKQEHLLHFCSKFSHHIKDEFTIFLPQLSEKIGLLLEELKGNMTRRCAVALAQTERRMGSAFPLEDTLRLMDEIQLVELNDRRINNFLRDLPEHVSVAATEVSQQWYAPKSGENASDAASTVASNNGAMIVTADGTAEGGILQKLGNKRISAPLATNDTTINDDGVGDMVPELRYVLEAWRLSCLTIQPHQLCTYNLPAVDTNITTLNDDVLEYIKHYVDSLEAGIAEQQAMVKNAESDKKEVSLAHQAVSPLLARFDDILEELKEQLQQQKTVSSALEHIKREEAQLAAADSANGF